MAQQTEFITFSGKGECRVCGAKYTARGMAPHMKKHMAEAFGDPNRFIIRIDQGPEGPFWMYVQVSTEATFGVLDKFLRAVWMECCGHLSEFTMGGRPAGKRKRLSAVLSDGAEFVYQYDMGDTTAVRLTVLGRSARLIDLGGLVRSDAYFPPPMVVGEDKVRILALHEKVRYNCEKCGNEAVYVCPQCIYDGTGACCEACAPSHKCGDDILLAAAQSPRVGACGFEGGSLG